MKELHYSIADEIFARFPGYARGVVLAYDVANGESPGEVVSLLRDAEASVRQQLKIDTIAEHPRIRSWREAFHPFGARPSEFRSSIEYNIDGLPPISVPEVDEVCRRLMDLVRRFCGGRTRYEILTREHPRIKLTE